jgi:5-methylcytosine-specific restriction protein A
MPNKAPHPCTYPGCTSLVSKGGRCARHEVKVVRDPEVHRLYGRRWQKESKAHLQSHPWCEDCLDVNVYTPATEVHHEQRHGGDPLVFRSSPKRALCKSCHSKRTAAEVHLPRGGEKVSMRGLSNVGKVSRVKNSPIETNKG